MPFDKEFDAVYTDLIKPTFEAVGYDVKRADDIESHQNILKDIVRSIASADLIIADLTSLNANVLYELGIAHALQKPVIIIAQSIDEVPFDLASYRVIQYSTHFKETSKLAEKLKGMAEKTKMGKLEFSNPISDFLDPDFIKQKIYTKISIEEEKASETSIEEEKIEEKGIWDFVVLSIESMQKLKDCAMRITEAMEEIGEKMQKRTQEAQKIQNSGVPGAVSQMYTLTKTTAYDMNLHAKKIEEEQPKLHSAWNEFVENTSGFIQIASIKNEKDREAIINYRDTVKGLKEVNKKSLEGIREYRKVVDSLKGISSDVNRASKRIIYVLDLLINDFVSADSYCTKIISLLDEKHEKAKNT
jgi:nucleoside 2-deoxyribosyltransferase